MEYLVTGGSGFIGSNVVRRLAGSRRSVRVLDNLSTGRARNLDGIDPGMMEFVQGDIRDPDTVRAALTGVRYVLHFAATPSVVRSVEDPIATNDVNVGGTVLLLKEARDAGVERFVFSSSSSVYGDTEILPKREDMPTMPLSPYAVQKLTGEHYCRVFHELYGLNTFPLRYFNVFGPRQDPASDYAAVIPLFAGCLRDGRPPTIFGDGEQTRDFTYVDNVVSANLACCEAPEEAAGEVYNVACGDRISVNDLASNLMDIMGSRTEPIHMDPRAGDVRDSQADASKAKSALGWQPEVAFREGLERTVKFFLGDEGAG
ncbi:MAG: SDR family oxidoreductase [Lentisphaerae bacterium]|nr:SDR family oxidoreductase [Lentisphaerota bacterium]